MDDEGEKSLEVQSTMEELFNKMSISVYKSNGELKNTFEIMQDLAGVYPTLTAAEKAYVTEAIAGKYQAQNAAAILENFGTAVKATETAMNSAGSATKENEKVLESITGKIQNLKSEFQNLARQLISSDLVKFVVDLGAGFLSLANTGLGQFIIKATLATASVIALDVALKKLKKTDFGSEIASLTKRIIGLGTAAGTSTFSVKALGTSFLGLGKNALAGLAPLMTSPLGWVIGGTALVVGLAKAVDYLTDTTRKYNKANDEYNESVDKTKEKQKSIDELESKIKALEAKGKDRTVVEEATLTQYKEQLKTLNKQLDKLKAQTNERKKQLEYAAKEKANQTGSYSRKSEISDIDFTSSSKSTPGMNQSNGMLSYQTRNQKQQTLPSYQEKTGVVTSFEEDEKRLETINKLFEKGNLSAKERKTLLKEQASILDYFKSKYQDYVDLSKLSGLSEKDQLEYKKKALEIQNAMNKAGTGDKGKKSTFGEMIFDDDKLQKSKTTIEDVSGTMSVLTEGTTTFGDALKKTAEDGTITEDEVKQLRSQYKDFDDTMRDSKTSNEDAANSLTEFANSVQYASSELAGIQADSLTKVSESIDNLQSAFQTLSTVQQEYSENGYLTVDTLQSLLDLDGKYLDSLTLQNGQLTLNKDNILAIANAKLDDAEAAATVSYANELETIAQVATGKATDAQKKKYEALIQTYQSSQAIIDKTRGTIVKFKAAIADSGNQEAVDLMNKATSRYEKQVAAINATRKGLGKDLKKTMGVSDSGKSKSKSSKSEKEWWEKELDNLKDQFEYNDITIEQYIGSLENLLGRVQQGTEAWKKINKELQKQKLQKVEDDYKRGAITLKQYIKELRNLQGAYKAGTDAWLDLADKIKNSLKELLNKQKDAYNNAHNAAMKIIETEIDKINEQKDATEEYYDKLIEDKKKANEESEKEIELAKLQEALANAKREKTKRVFREGIGWVWETDKSAIEEAQKDLDDFMNDKELKELEDAKDKALSVFEEQLKAWDKYKESWNDVVDDYENQQARLTLQQTLGADAEAKILQQRLDVLEKFKNEYNSTLAQIDALEKTSSTNTGAMNSYYNSARSFAGGIKNGVIDYSGYARVHGSSANPEYILNNGQMKNLLSSLTRPGYGRVGIGSGSQVNNYNFGDLNLPNVSNASQFVTELKSIVNITKHQ